MPDRVGQPEPGDVEPGQVGGFDRRVDGHPGQLAGDEIPEVIAVSAQVVQQRAAPGLAVAVGGRARGVAEAVDFGDNPGGGAQELLAERGVGNDGQRGAEARNIVGLARRH